MGFGAVGGAPPMLKPPPVVLAAESLTVLPVEQPPAIDAAPKNTAANLSMSALNTRAPRAASPASALEQEPQHRVQTYGTRVKVYGTSKMAVHVSFTILASARSHAASNASEYAA
jgi:hypothetical protein